VIDSEKERDACWHKLNSVNKDNERLKALYEQLLRDKQRVDKQQEEHLSAAREWETNYGHLQDEIQRLKDAVELEKY
jgi:uncharacterized protein YfcZ (UPF0381/DUF406 family)